MEKIWAAIEKILYVCVFKVLHIRLNQRQWRSLMQFVQFGMVGFSNTVISYVVYIVLITLGIHYLPASIIGFVASVINSFYWNNRYVFAANEGEQRSLWKSFCKCFFSYAGTGLILNNILLIIQIRFLGWSKQIAPLLNLIITIPLNFVLNKLWAFRRT